MFLHLSVSHSVHRGGVCRAEPHPPDRPPWADTPLGIQTPQQTATAADGTHPTGMYSCSHMMLNYVKKIKGAAHKAVTLMVNVNKPGIVHQGVSTEVLIVTEGV